MEKANVEEKCGRRIRRESQRSMLPLLTLTAFLVVLVFLFAAGPVYAPDTEPNSIISDEGADAPPWTIEGRVINSEAFLPVPNINVYLYLNIMQTTTTGSDGFFRFPELWHWCEQ